MSQPDATKDFLLQALCATALAAQVVYTGYQLTTHRLQYPHHTRNPSTFYEDHTRTLPGPVNRLIDMMYSRLCAHSSVEITASHLFKSTSLICLTAIAVTSGLVQLTASTSIVATVAVVLLVKDCSLLLFSLPAASHWCVHRLEYPYQKPTTTTDQCWWLA